MRALPEAGAWITSLARLLDDAVDEALGGSQRHWEPPLPGADRTRRPWWERPAAPDGRPEHGRVEADEVGPLGTGLGMSPSRTASGTGSAGAGDRRPRTLRERTAGAAVALGLAVVAAAGAGSGGAATTVDHALDAVTSGAAGTGSADGDGHAAGSTPPAAPAPDGSEVASHYQVRPGDSLSRVAALHAVPASALADHNGLQPPYGLRPGDRLAIPAPTGEQPPPPRPGSPEAPRVERAISRWADANDLPVSLLAAMTWHESRWEEDARSEAGAVGVGQVLPTTATWVADELIGEPLDPTRVDDNVRLSAHYLRWLIDRADGDHAAALAGYYQGEASVAETGWYDDTDDYVAAVFDLRWRFRDAPT